MSAAARTNDTDEDVRASSMSGNREAGRNFDRPRLFFEVEKMSNHYITEAEIEKVVSDFEGCLTAKEDFHHQQHLVVATSYLQSDGIEGAIARMRESLVRFLTYHAVDNRKYNETLTQFWLQIVALELQRLPAKATLLDKCNSILKALDNPKLASEFYSAEVLWSEEARQMFVEPDLDHWK